MVVPRAQTLVQLTDRLLAALDQHAAKVGRNRSDVIREAIERYLEESLEDDIGRAIVELAVVARASADRVGPYEGGLLRVRVTRPATGGEANRAVTRLVAAALDVPTAAVEIVAGHRARRKRLRVATLDDGELGRRLRNLATR
jgi:uncharacterized protein YggU (UPF0235/DUF167 family)